MTVVLFNGNLVLRFLLELSALAAVGWSGWRAGDGALRPLLAAGAVALVAVVWAVFVSPQASIDVAGPARLAIELGVWTAAGAALAATGNQRLAVAFVAVAVASGALNYGSRRGSRAAPPSRGRAKYTKPSASRSLRRSNQARSATRWAASFAGRVLAWTSRPVPSERASSTAASATSVA